MNTLFLDSASGPTAPAAASAVANGVTGWGLYVGGPGAYHAWTAAEVEVVKAAGLLPVPIWVPTYTLGEDPAQAAADAIGAATALGVYRALVLDTEQRMRTIAGPARVAAFSDAFYAAVKTAGWWCPEYGGAGYYTPGAPQWAPLWGSTLLPQSGCAIQYGPNAAGRYGQIRAGSVDVNRADALFPYGSFVPPAPPAPPAPPILVQPIPGENMQQVTGNVTTDSHGRGWVDLPVPPGSTVIMAAAPGIVVAKPGTPQADPTGDLYDDAYAQHAIGAPAGWSRVAVVSDIGGTTYGVGILVTP